ncbi:MAG: hypothetical protein LBL84_00565 [Candidatus Nomurabacteria bacterium]|jgi:hypothetical protein|nr:hypothetical protein [Candidatus Nomurabacteria bacterium]
MDNQALPPIQPAPSANPPGAEYLDQIAVKPKSKTGFFSVRMLVLLGLLVVSIVSFVAIAASSSGKSPKANSETLYLRVSNLQKTADKFHKHLKSSSLRAINATYRTQLTSVAQELSGQLPKLDIKTDKIDKKVKADETTRIDKINQELEDARLNVQLDRNYAKEMAYQIELVVSLMQKIEKSAKKDYKTMIESTLPKLESMANQFSKFTDD